MDSILAKSTSTCSRWVEFVMMQCIPSLEDALEEMKLLLQHDNDGIIAECGRPGGVTQHLLETNRVHHAVAMAEAYHTDLRFAQLFCQLMEEVTTHSLVGALAFRVMGAWRVALRAMAAFPRDRTVALACSRAFVLWHRNRPYSVNWGELVEAGALSAFREAARSHVAVSEADGVNYADLVVTLLQSAVFVFPE